MAQEDTITYSLRGDRDDSRQYYLDVASFTDEVLEKTASLASIIQDFQASLAARREPLEPEFEILMLGTLWRTYGSRGAALPALPRLALKGLSALREKVPSLKPGADRIRGLLGTLCLSPFASTERFKPSEAELDSFLGWLSATGEFKQEERCFRDWRNYWDGQSSHKAFEEMSRVLAFSSWFDRRSEEVLGGYTLNVDRFLETKHPDYAWREDVIACGRKRVEYHANMVGAEILNRSYRKAFSHQPRREVLLPSCMANRGVLCRAKGSPLGLRCSGCDPECRIGEVTKLGERHGFGVIVLKHQSTLFKDWPSGEVAIVGIACGATLIGGGLKAKSLNIPAQCVLLDGCGCKSHWHEKGIKTDIYLDQLYRILGLEDAEKIAK